MPFEVLKMIAHHLTEWNGQNIMNESNDLDVHTRWPEMIGRLQPQNVHELIEKSAHHKLSSFLFTFRLVCKICAAAGLEVFLECARTERYAHYTTLHLPPPARMSIPELTSMLLRQPSLSNRMNELVIHVVPDYVPHVPDYQILSEPNSAENHERALSFCRDAVRIFGTYDNDSLHCGHLYSRSGPQDPLQLLMRYIRTIRTVQIQYDDFWFAPQFGKHQAQIPHFQIMPMSPQAWTYDLLSRLWRAPRGYNCPNLKLTNIGTDFLRFLDTLHDRSTARAAARTTNLEISLTARDDFFGIREPGLPDIGPLCGGRAPTFLEGFHNLISLTLDFNINFNHYYHSANNPLLHSSQQWIENSFNVQHWPQLQSLVLRQLQLNADTLITFLRWHRATLEHVELGSISFTGAGFYDNNSRWPHMLLALRYDMSLRSVRIATQAFRNRMTQAALMMDPTFPDLAMPRICIEERYWADALPYREIERRVERWVLRQEPRDSWQHVVEFFNTNGMFDLECCLW